MAKKAPKPEREDDDDDREFVAPRGHNKAPKAGGLGADQLKSIVSRMEKLQEEKEAISADMRDVMAEAKGNGFDAKTVRFILNERKIAASEREERDALRDTYLHAMGMLPSLDDEHGSEE